jgi:hypothetical protein
MVRDEADAFALPYCRRSAPFKILINELFAATISSHQKPGHGPLSALKETTSCKSLFWAPAIFC